MDGGHLVAFGVRRLHATDSTSPSVASRKAAKYSNPSNPSNRSRETVTLGNRTAAPMTCVDRSL
jgi:hypothetical protein